MTFQLTEGAVRAVRSFLEAQLPAKIAEINARSPDALVLESPRTFILGEPELKYVTKWPVCYVLGTEYEVVNWGNTPGGGWIKANHTIEAGIAVNDTGAEALTLKSWRSVLAIQELFHAALLLPSAMGEYQMASKPKGSYAAAFSVKGHYHLEGAVQVVLTRLELSTP